MIARIRLYSIIWDIDWVSGVLSRESLVTLVAIYAAHRIAVFQGSRMLLTYLL